MHQLSANRVKVLISFLLLSCLFTISSHAQNGKISGKIIDGKTGETLPGATVLVESTTTGASADFDGNFTISNLKPGIYNLQCKFISYADKLLKGVEVKAGDVTNVNISMEEPKSDTLQEVVVVSVISRENTNALIMMQKNNASVSDGISADAIKKTPDRNTSDVLKRVSGASIQDNKFAIIRGMNDRYNAAFLNGAPLPSSESDRKAFAFDIFPSNMLDNLIITKTATPDMPGDFAGGVITINTKDIPEKSSYQISISGGYNPMVTNKNFRTYEGGDLDWLGVDDGTRALKDEIPETENYSTISTGTRANDTMAYYAKKMKYSWGLKNQKALPNGTLQATVSNVGKIFKMDAGSIFAINYQNNNNIQIVNRREFEEQGTEVLKIRDYLDTIYSNTILASALWNLALKVNDKHKISFKNLYSVNSEDKVTTREGITDATLPQTERSNVKWFTQNNIYSGQLEGTHLFLSEKLKLKWVGGYSNIVRDIPCMRKMVYNKQSLDIDDATPLAAATQNNNVTTNAAGTMFFAKTNESIKSFRYDISYNLPIKKMKNEIKIGGFHQIRDREFAARLFGFTKYKYNQPWKFDNTLLVLPEEEIFDESHMGVQNKPGKNYGFKLSEATTPADGYTASSKLHAGYLMIDSRFLEKFRVIYGLRVESYQQTLNTKLITSGVAQDLKLDTTVIDLLPSINFVYSLSEKTNIRAAYYRTVSRPEFRELAPFNFYDFILDFSVSGNPALKRASINNYDLRFEWFPGAAQVLSVSGFYKDISNAIEQISNTASQIRSSTFVNVKKVTNIGAELEYRVKIGTLLKTDSIPFLMNSTLYMNFAYISSNVDVSGIVGAEKRPLQGQSPFLLNAGYQYNDFEKGWSGAISYNLIGRRIFIVGTTDEPTYWENPRHVLDLQVSKTFKKKFELKFNVRDVLAQRVIFYQDLNKNGKLDKNSEIENQNYNHANNYDNVMINTRVGSAYSLSFSVKF